MYMIAVLVGINLALIGLVIVGAVYYWRHNKLPKTVAQKPPDAEPEFKDMRELEDLKKKLVAEAAAFQALMSYSVTDAYAPPLEGGEKK